MPEQSIVFDEMMAAGVLDLIMAQPPHEVYDGPLHRVLSLLQDFLDTVRDSEGNILWRKARVNPENIQADDVAWVRGKAYCHSCGILISEDHKYCPNCGTYMGPKVFDGVCACGNCGHETYGGDCPNCGEPGPLCSFLVEEDDGQPDEQQEWHDFDPDC
jgi:RNA polymerase subunit RPABC4/transcription elongation factor Spt4